MSNFDKMFEGPLYVLQKMVPKMVARDLKRATCHCKSCGGRDTVLIQRGKPGPRGEVIRFKCKTAGCSNMGMT